MRATALIWLLPAAASAWHTVVVGDVGGTNTRLALYSLTTPIGAAADRTLAGADTGSTSTPGTLLLAAQYRNDEYASFDAVYSEFSQQACTSAATAPPTSACIAIAGPVVGDTCAMTNRAWPDICAREIEAAHSIQSVQLINDFVAAGYGCLTLDLATEVECLQGAAPLPASPIACIGPGTGLGETYLTPSYGGPTPYSAWPTEGGHTDFAPRTTLESDLLDFLKRKHAADAGAGAQPLRVSVERVVSGPGLASVYEFLAERYPTDVSPDIAAAFAAAGDMQGRVVSEGASRSADDEDGAAPDKLCAMAVQMFVAAFGSEAGNCALKYMPFGGLFLAGGLTPKNIKHMRATPADVERDGANAEGPLLRALLDKGRMRRVLERVPVYAVLVDNLGERGAHLVAVNLLRAAIRREEDAKADAAADDLGALEQAASASASGDEEERAGVPLRLPLPPRRQGRQRLTSRWDSNVAADAFWEDQGDAPRAPHDKLPTVW